MSVGKGKSYLGDSGIETELGLVPLEPVHQKGSDSDWEFTPSTSTGPDGERRQDTRGSDDLSPKRPRANEKTGSVRRKTTERDCLFFYHTLFLTRGHSTDG